VDYCSAAALLVRRSLWEQLGGFDCGYAPAHYEDIDLCFRIRQAGKRVVVQPKALVVHFEGVSHGRDSSSGVKAHQHAHQALFTQRWQAVLQRDHEPRGQHTHWASDRVKARPMVLVADHKLPEPDRDAGSRSILHLMRGLVAAGALVTFWPHNPALTERYRSQLAEEGIELLAYNDQAYTLEQLAAWVEEHRPVLDWLLLSRPDVAESVLTALGPTAELRLAYYGHDLHHRRLERQASHQGADPSLMERAALALHQEQQVWQQVDLIYYPAADEVQEMQQWLRGQGKRANVRQLPVFAYTDSELAQAPTARQPPEVARLLFVAGFAHPPNSDAAQWFVREAWPLVRQGCPSAQLWLVGSDPPAAIEALGGVSIHITGSVSEEVLKLCYQQARVALAPIRHGAGVNGKVVEALRHGVPCVCTPQAARGFCDHGAALRIASDPQAFAEACLLLLTSTAHWQRQAEAGLAYVRQHFSAERLDEVLQPLLTHGGSCSATQSTNERPSTALA
jgi:glycosyltransferase involved in cell wall biosynthesis